MRTRSGYAGGTKADPTYHSLGDHTETVQIDYDPQRVSYDQLLAVFWNSHRPTPRAWSRQYMNAIFFHDDQQEQLAEQSKARIKETHGRAVHTKVLPVQSFTQAEDYHQKYILNRNGTLASVYKRIYSEHQDFVDSTAVARVNGYVGGYGDLEQLRKELPDLGLGQAHQRILLDLVGGRPPKPLN